MFAFFLIPASKYSCQFIFIDLTFIRSFSGKNKTDNQDNFPPTHIKVKPPVFEKISNRYHVHLGYFLFLKLGIE